LEWHPWSNSQLTWAGGVSGSGPMSTSDSGSIFLGGTNNTWDGIATLNSGATIGAGDGANLSWNTDAGFYGINGFFGINYNEDFTWSGTFGRPLGTGPGEVANLGLRKLGTGTLFADVPQVYTQQTRVENGMLKVIDPDGIPHGEVSVYAPGVVDVNGHNLTFAKLHNVGNVIDSDGAATELTVGDNGNFALEAKVAPSMILRKVGTGTAVLNGNATSGPFEVDAGNISMGIQSRTPNTTHLNGASGLLFSVANPNATPPLEETRGLKAHYYQFASSPGTGRIGSIDQIRALMADNAPVLVTDTLGAGETFDFGNDGRYFPPPFDVGAEFFAALYSGYFRAETAGTYCFGLLSDDGSALYLDGKQIINNNRDQAYGSEPVSNTVYLAEGLYPIVIGFYQGGSAYGLTAFVQRPGEEELAPIPQDLLRPGEFFSARVDNLEGNPNTRLTLSGSATLDFLANTDSLFSGSIVSSPDAAIAKTGPARQTLTSAAAFTLGRASVLEGTLEMNAIGTIGETLFVDAATTFASPRPFFGLLGRYYGWGLSAVPVPRAKLEDLGVAEAALADSPEYVMSVITPSVFNFNNNGNGFPPPYNAGAECFVVLWKGHINLPADGTYTFYTASDDGSMLFIDREVVVWNNQDQAVTEKSGTGYFTAGWHEIAITYYQGGGGYGLFANIEGPGLPKQFIPNTMLRMSPYMTAEEATLAPMLTASGRIAGEGTVDLASIGTLGLAPDGNYTFAGSFAGDRFSALVKTAPGTVTLTGDNSAFCGTIYITDGGIALAGNGTLGNVRIVTGSDGIVAFDGEGASRFGGTIEGPGTLRFIGSGDATLLHGLDNFSGTVEFVGGQSLTLTGPWMNMLADQIQGAPSVTLTDGATLALTPGGGYPPDITASNAFISLAITNASSVWSLDKLHIQADGDVTVVCSGLWGEYYDLIEHNTSVISNAFLSASSAETFLGDPNNATFSHKASTWEAGPTMDFGCSAHGDVHFPGYAPDAEYFAAIFRGQIRIPEMRQYCFATVSDDFSMVFIDGHLVVDNNGTHDMWRKSGYVTLDEGLHDIVILYCQCDTGLGFRFEMSADGADALATAPNHLLFSHVADIPPYTLNIADLGVENAGTGSLILTGPGTLGMSGLWFDDGALLDVTADHVQVTGSTLTATVSEDIPKDKRTLVGDLTKTSGLDLTGITRTVIGPDDARLIYRNGYLYVSRIHGTVLILR
ncbi:MAG: PA14 domain-containing protein, partial [Kiritimatiellaeota bacterium]|nr:PA14 domain-containing protein [Kiritimatiellota bacterium]